MHAAESAGFPSHPRSTQHAVLPGLGRRLNRGGQLSFEGTYKLIVRESARDGHMLDWLLGRFGGSRDIGIVIATSRRLEGRDVSAILPHYGTGQRSRPCDVAAVACSLQSNLPRLAARLGFVLPC